ncbi:DASH family cryptochrome [Psychroflexus aestuariivivens]|uniref:DASH family cryptochrome n=1 Tax=Psychroflexus aestuariivivens TaxID=1795040 RepID=UPI000FDA50D4|nr:DASH family cryptochrome [Psychroflexus aestuariivivens]
MQTKQNINVVWFRNDLRTEDQQSLAKACDQETQVIGLYCFDPRHYVETKYGFKKTEKYRAKFCIESVQSLQKNLKALNIGLNISCDTPEATFEKLSNDYKIQNLFFQKEWTQEEFEIEKSLRKKLPDTNFIASYDQFMYHPNDVPFENWNEIPEVYTSFRKHCEKKAIARKPTPKPDAKPKEHYKDFGNHLPSLSDLGLTEFELDFRSAFPFEGGEDEAWKRLNHYFWNTKKLQYYKKTRNGLLGTDYSSKFSAWLANGSISAVSTYHQVKKFESEVKKNQDTYWLIFELIWRDYFKYISLKHGNKIFQLGGILDKNYEWQNDEKAFKKWINGTTEEDFVNANMLEIKNTGFMSNRGRQNVNSFWAKEWQQDWRIGAAYFESMLIDYDVHSNWGNWMYNSGVGNDPRDRKFNIKTQAKRYDPNGNYQRTWLQKTLFE